MSRYQETSGPFGHSRIITVIREVEPETWSPKVIRPEGLSTGITKDKVSSIVEETWECSMGHLRRVTR